MPADSNQAAAAAEKAMEIISEGHKSVYIFSARSGHPQLLTPEGDVIYGPDYVFDGKIDIIRGTGDALDEVTIIATGIAVHDAVMAADQLWTEDKMRVRVLNAACVRPLDASAIIQAALETRHLIVAEDHHSEGGLATQVADVIADFQLPCSLRRLGVNHYFPSGNADDLKFLAGLDHESMMEAARDELKKEVCGGEDALVTAIYTMTENSRQSRFLKSAELFIDRLLTEKNYLAELRNTWKKRTSATLPKDEVLKEKLREHRVE
jgi:transketolase C-terminal domain/subunit